MLEFLKQQEIKYTKEHKGNNIDIQLQNCCRYCFKDADGEYLYNAVPGENDGFFKFEKRYFTTKAGGVIEFIKKEESNV